MTNCFTICLYAAAWLALQMTAARQRSSLLHGVHLMQVSMCWAMQYPLLQCKEGGPTSWASFIAEQVVYTLCHASISDAVHCSVILFPADVMWERPGYRVSG